MSSVSLDTVTQLARIAFLLGAVTDGLAILPMLSRRVGAALFGGNSSRSHHEYRYAMGIGASLMAGWTLLLLWGAASPLERRAILVLTIFPVITGIVAATVLAVRRGVIRLSHAIPLWAHLGAVSVFYAVVYVLLGRFAP
ncbi:hypothetical protein JXA88_11785 [Candidatus Fermentibacteria bacterium]|nr:hypothetical protein [Candidatus Fermentibacteria bacterium]